MSEIIKPQKVKVGDRYSRLLVVKQDFKYEGKNSKFICKCDCGVIKSFFAFSLVERTSQSCGCLAVEVNTKHGWYGTPEYKVWASMKERCFNPKNMRYKNYGARGITVCDRWLQFENFINDMGKRPSGEHSLERDDNNGHYEKDNCFWATEEKQRNNKQNTRYYEHDGVKKSQAQWARYFKINSPSQIARQIEKGKSFDEIFVYYEIKNMSRKIEVPYSFS